MTFSNFKKAYVWQYPVRIFHWLNAICIVVLCITGFIIADPPAIMSNKGAYEQFWFGWIRMIHFIAAYLFILAMILRVYWALSKSVNQFASWRAFIPFLSRKGWIKIWYTVKREMLLQTPKKTDVDTEVVGHNPIAIMSYVLMFFLALVMIATGFALYEPNASWFLPKMFKWVVPLLGNDYNVRLIHHLTMWVFILFSIVHIYLVFFTDWQEGRGEASAMLSGFKFVPEDRIKENNA